MRRDLKERESGECFLCMRTTTVLVLFAAITIYAWVWMQSNAMVEEKAHMELIEKGMAIQLQDLKGEKTRLEESIKNTKKSNEDMAGTIEEKEKKMKDLEKKLKRNEEIKKLQSGRHAGIKTKLRETRQAHSDADYDLWKLQRKAKKAHM